VCTRASSTWTTVQSDVARIAMRSSPVSLWFVAALLGCETAPTYSSSPGEHVTVVHPGDAAVSVVGTPFYLAFKGVACAVSAVIAAPVAGMAALNESHSDPKIREGLGDGLSRNCGPPYILSPYRVVSVEPTPNVPKMSAPRQSLEPAAGIPEMPTPAEPPEPPVEYSAAPMSEEFPEPAAGGPIQLFIE
jgi:hypothetical protein